MRKITLLFAFCMSLLACKDSEKENKETAPVKSNGAYAKSAGRTNTLTIVMENVLWEGEIGDVLRKHLADGVPGLPQEEPLFTIRQMSPNAFSGFARKSRCFLRINDSKPSNYEILKNKYARPQIGVEISGNSAKSIIENFTTHKNEIINTFKAVELLNRQSVVKHPLLLKDLKDDLGLGIRVPKAYRIAKQEDDFYWIRKNISHGSMDLLLYELPFDSFKDSLSASQNIIHLRDEVGSKKIAVDDGGQFITEEAFSPFIKETKFLGFDAYETRGTWEVKNKFMAGPFINYTVKDTTNNRLLVLEGFVFAPSISKRDYLFELESIIKTIELK